MQQWRHNRRCVEITRAAERGTTVLLSRGIAYRHTGNRTTGGKNVKLARRSWSGELTKQKYFACKLKKCSILVSTVKNTKFVEICETRGPTVLQQKHEFFPRMSVSCMPASRARLSNCKCNSCAQQALCRNNTCG